MKYLFGDGTESTLSFNYLEYLRAALGFSSSVLKGETNVEARVLEAEQARERAKEELLQLEEVARKMEKALEEIGGETSAQGARGCVESLSAATKGEIDRAKSTIESSLSRDLQRLSSIIAGERAANERRLEKLLLGHDLPKCNRWINATTDDEGKFQATLEGKSGLEVEYSIALEIPDGHLLASPLRIDRVDPELSIKVPQNAGWGRKGVKIRTFKLAKEFVVAFRNQAPGDVIELRNATTEGHSGYDLACSDNQVTVTRISKQQQGDPFVADAEDTPKLLNLRDVIKNAVDDLSNSRKTLTVVKFGGVPLRDHEEPSKLVQSLVDEMVPVVREITEHSLTRGELVLKSVLGDDRREEIFASIVDLGAILGGLPDDKKAMFSPLGFDGYIPSKIGEEKPDESPLVEELDDDSLLEVSDDDIEEELGSGLHSLPKRSSVPPPFRSSSVPSGISRPSSIPRPSSPPPTPSSPPGRPSSLPKPSKKD